jgi:hypothetical protein
MFIRMGGCSGYDEIANGKIYCEEASGCVYLEAKKVFFLEIFVFIDVVKCSVNPCLNILPDEDGICSVPYCMFV